MRLETGHTDLLPRSWVFIQIVWASLLHVVEIRLNIFFQALIFSGRGTD